MGHHSRRQQQRARDFQQHKAAEKAAKAAPAPQPEAPGFLGSLWNSFGLGGGETGAEVQGEAENVGKVNDRLADRQLRHEKEDARTAGNQDLFKEEEPAASSWWDYLPTFGVKTEKESQDGVRIAGEAGDDEDTYVDLLSSKHETSGYGKVGVKGAEAGFETEHNLAMLKGAAKGEGKAGALRYGGEVEGSFMEADASAKGKVGVGWEGAEAEAEAEAGAYLGKVGAKAEGGLKIPFLNARLFGGAEAEGSLGVGASAKGKAKLDASGFEMGGRVGGSLGFGGALGFNWGVKKDDDKKGWFE